MLEVALGNSISVLPEGGQNYTYPVCSFCASSKTAIERGIMFLNKLLQADFTSRKLKRILGLHSTTESKAENLNLYLIDYKRPLISVVLPVYNHAKLISKSIESVLLQNLPVELIIVDDGSTDNLKSVLTKYLKDKRITLIQKENGGIASALNLGFQSAKAPFLTWTSADNSYLPGALSELFNSLLNNPDAALTYGNVELVDEYGKLISNAVYRPSDQFGSGLSLTREGESLFYYDDNFISSCFLYRSSFANLAGEYLTNCQGIEDYEYWLRLTAFSPAIHTYSSAPLYQYRLHPNSLTATLDSAKLARKTREIRIHIKRARKNVQCNPLPEKLERAVAESSMKIPIQIKRSRDGDFKSLPDNSLCTNVGIIYISGEELVIDKYPEINFSIYPLNTPDHYLLELADRGFNIFSDHPTDFLDLPEDEYRARSLMFYLSRLDYLLIPSTNWSPEELRYKAGLAAAAGLELRVLRKSTLNEADIEFLDLFLPSRHILFFNSISEALSTEPKFNISREYFEKWLYSQSYAGISNLVKTGILAKELKKIILE